MNRSRFGAHGEVKAHYDAQNNVLYVDLIGPFNTEFVKHYQEVVGREREVIPVAKWVSLVTVQGMAFASFDVLSEAEQALGNAVKLGLTATAVVLKVTEAKSMQEKFWSRVYEKTKLPHAFFDTEEDAFYWLQSQQPLTDTRINNNPFKKVIR
jgi:hypothetical protein